MPCTSPLILRRDPNGLTTSDRGSGAVNVVKVRCKQCAHCRLRKRGEWSVRIMHEAQMHKRNCFITLTYADSEVPRDYSLEKYDFQCFMKRLRKNLGLKVRYFHAGEYGDRYLRPHYHAILFGVDFLEDRTRVDFSSKYPLFRSPTLESLWGLGFVTLAPVTLRSAAYVAKYTQKKVNGALAPRYHRVHPVTGEYWAVNPEYATQSRKPGLGHAWFQKYRQEVYVDDCVILEGKRYPTPEYYDSLLDEQELESVKAKRRENIKYDKDLTPERLAVRERVVRRRLTSASERSKF